MVEAEMHRWRWARHLLAGLAVVAAAAMGVTVPNVAAEPLVDVASDPVVIPAPGEGPEPSGRDVPPMSQRVVDTAVWVWVLAVVAVAAGWVVVRWRRSGDPTEGTPTGHH